MPIEKKKLEKPDSGDITAPISDKAHVTGILIGKTRFSGFLVPRSPYLLHIPPSPSSRTTQLSWSSFLVFAGFIIAQSPDPLVCAAPGNWNPRCIKLWRRSGDPSIKRNGFGLWRIIPFEKSLLDIRSFSKALEMNSRLVLRRVLAISKSSWSSSSRSQ